MRTLSYRLFSTILLVALIVTTTSCGGSNTQNTTDSHTLTFWYGGSVVGEDEVEQSQETWTIPTLIRMYEEQTGITVNATYFEDEEAMVQLIANNGRLDLEVPDVACIYSSELLRDMSDVIYPLNQYISDDEKNSILFWETVTDNGLAIDSANAIYGYPFGGTEVTFIAYNRDVFNSLGIDVENNPPVTFEEFYNLCEQLHDGGIIPIVASDDGWNELYLQVFSKRWVQFSGDNRIISEAKGENSFYDDNNLRASFELANEYYSNGFINKDYATNTDASTMFINGKGAMFSCSNYDINMFRSIMGDAFGVFYLPDFSGEGLLYPSISFGGCNQCLSTFNKSANKEDAIALIRWLSNKENNIFMSQNFGCFPNRNDIAINEYDENPGVIIEKIYPLLEYAHCTPDYLMPAKLCEEFYKYSTEAVIGQISIDDFLNVMDELAK